jgi:hypothetical protein
MGGQSLLERTRFHMAAELIPMMWTDALGLKTDMRNLQPSVW